MTGIHTIIRYLCKYIRHEHPPNPVCQLNVQIETFVSYILNILAISQVSNTRSLKNRSFRDDMRSGLNEEGIDYIFALRNMDSKSPLQFFCLGLSFKYQFEDNVAENAQAICFKFCFNQLKLDCCKSIEKMQKVRLDGTQLPITQLLPNRF